MGYDYNALREKLPDMLLSREQFRPFPEWGDARWDAVDGKIRKWVIAAAERCAKEPPHHFTATEYMNYFRTGERDYDDVAGFRRSSLMLLTAAECYEHSGRFIDPIIDIIWSICEESTWVYPAHNWQGLEGGWDNDSTRPLPDVNDPQIDLFSAETGACLAWVYSVLRNRLDEVSYLITERIERELERRIIEPFCYRRDFWWMSSHVHNWHIWCTANCLAVTLLIERNPKKRALGTGLALKFVESFLSHFPADGGNSEGITYWGVSGGSLYIALKLLLLASDGRLDLFGDERVHRIASFFYKMHVDGRGFFNHGYCTYINDQVIGSEVYNFGVAMKDGLMEELGALLFSDYESSSGRSEIYNYGSYNPFTYMEYFTTTHRPSVSGRSAPYLGYVWYDTLQCFCARENPGSGKGFFVGAIGHNGESDRHLDGGEFILCLDGKPVYIDLGNVRYSRKVIDNRYRYDHFLVQTENHNAITVNGCGQSVGAAGLSRARSGDSDSYAYAEFDLSTSYKPQAGVKRCVRTVSLDRAAGTVTISQQVECDRVSDISLHFITNEPPVSTPGHIFVSGTELAYDAALFTAKTEEIDTENDPSLRANWGDHLYRTTLTAHAQSIDAAVTIRR